MQQLANQFWAFKSNTLSKLSLGVLRNLFYIFIFVHLFYIFGVLRDLFYIFFFLLMLDQPHHEFLGSTIVNGEKQQVSKIADRCSA